VNRIAQRGLRIVHRFTGHAPECSIRGTITGHWLWYAGCRCGDVQRGAEFDRETAKRRAQAARRSAYRKCNAERAAQLWPEITTLRANAFLIELPEELRGNGYTVACDGSLRARDQHAGWGFVTDAGWSGSGTRKFAGAHINSLELMAIGQALRIYPAASNVWVLSDNHEARATARRMLRGELSLNTLPSWVCPEHVRLFGAAMHRGLMVEIVTVRSKTNPLHNLADRLARQLDDASEVLAA
jgi:ribonuclease HI